jgi:hypothetical protein
MIGPPFVNCRLSRRGINLLLYFLTLSTYCGSEDLTSSPGYCINQLEQKCVMNHTFEQKWLCSGTEVFTVLTKQVIVFRDVDPSLANCYNILKQCTASILSTYIHTHLCFRIFINVRSALNMKQEYSTRLHGIIYLAIVMFKNGYFIKKSQAIPVRGCGGL